MYCSGFIASNFCVDNMYFSGFLLIFNSNGFSLYLLLSLVINEFCWWGSFTLVCVVCFSSPWGSVCSRFCGWFCETLWCADTWNVSTSIHVLTMFYHCTFGHFSIIRMNLWGFLEVFMVCNLLSSFDVSLMYKV